MGGKAVQRGRGKEEGEEERKGIYKHQYTICLIYMLVVNLTEHCLHIWKRLTRFSHYYMHGHGSSLHCGNLIVCSNF